MYFPPSAINWSVFKQINQLYDRLQLGGDSVILFRNG